MISWIEAVRGRGITLLIRVGVASSAGIAKKYGFSLTNLMGSAGPNRFIRELESRYDASVHGVVKLHFYTFGGLASTQQWITSFREGDK